MTTFSLGALLQKLADLGLETIGYLQGKRSQDSEDPLCTLCQTLLQLKGEAASPLLPQTLTLLCAAYLLAPICLHLSACTYLLAPICLHLSA